MMPLSVRADELTVEDGTDTSNNCPLLFYNTDYYYCRSQFTYTSSEISALQGKVITALKFYSNGYNAGSQLSNLYVKVKIGNCASDTYSTGDTWKTDPTTVELVGHVTYSQNGTNGSTLTLTLNTGYYYTTGNLLIEIENMNTGYGMYCGTNANHAFYGEKYSGSNYYSAYKNVSSSSNSYPVTATPTLSNFSPKCTFTYSNLDIAEGLLYDNCYFKGSWIGKSLNATGAATNWWMVGDSAYTTPGWERSLYVSGYVTGGNRYVNTSTGYDKVVAYKFITLEANTDYTISYDWRCNGESTYDFMRVALLPISAELSATGWTYNGLPSSAIALDGGTKLNGSTNWQNKALIFRTGSATQYRLVVYWQNDVSGINQTAAAIDDIRVTKVQTASYHNDFETANQYAIWQTDENNGYNSWAVGDDVYSNGSHSMYIGVGGGHDYDYENTSTTNAYTYIPMRMKAGRYLVSYDWKCVGETNYDYMKVGFAPYYSEFNVNSAAMPTGTIYADGGNTVKLCNQSTWTTKTVIVTIPTDTVYNFFLFWHNDNSDGSDPAAVDNLSITPIQETNIEHAFLSASYCQQYGYLWTTANGLCENYWKPGWYLQINNNNSYSYDITSSSSVFAYAAVQLTAGSYDISYRWQANGESDYDYLRVALVPDTMRLAPGTTIPTGWGYNSLPAGAIAADGGSQLYGSNTLDSLQSTITVPTTGVWKLVFYWRNDNSQGSQDPARVDDITLIPHETPSYTITVTSNNTAWGTVTGGGTYTDGATATLTATANSGYHFVSWQDGNTTNPRTITVTQNATYEAIFAQDAATQYTITVTANNVEWGTVSGGGVYNEGAIATITATPNVGYEFLYWSDGNSDNPRSFTVTGNASFQAIFNAVNGIGNVDAVNLFTLYPNPASNMVTISVEGADGENSIELIDINGRTVIEETDFFGNTVTLQLDGVASGVYFVRFVNNGTVQLRKLVVK